MQEVCGGSIFGATYLCAVRDRRRPLARHRKGSIGSEADGRAASRCQRLFPASGGTTPRTAPRGAWRGFGDIPFRCSLTFSKRCGRVPPDTLPLQARTRDSRRRSGVGCSRCDADSCGCQSVGVPRAVVAGPAPDAGSRARCRRPRRHPDVRHPRSRCRTHRGARVPRHRRRTRTDRRRDRVGRDRNLTPTRLHCTPARGTGGRRARGRAAASRQPLPCALSESARAPGTARARQRKLPSFRISCSALPGLVTRLRPVGATPQPGLPAASVAATPATPGASRRRTRVAATSGRRGRAGKVRTGRRRRVRNRESAAAPGCRPRRIPHPVPVRCALPVLAWPSPVASLENPDTPLALEVFFRRDEIDSRS